MSPFPGTRVIDPGWAEHHRPAIEATMTATCTIRIGGAGGWDPTSGPSSGDPATVLYDGRPCRVQDLSRAAAPVDAAGQLVTEHPYLVAIKADAPEIPAGALVHVDSCTDDPWLVGTVFTVVSASLASLRLERDLMCDLDPANQPEA